MFGQVNPAVARESRARFQQLGTPLHASCILCRVLWPLMLQHRHLLVGSTEATALVLKKKKPREIGLSKSPELSCKA